MRGSVFASSREVILCLLTYTDWWQPPTTSLIQVGNIHRNGKANDGLPAGLLENLDERTELCRRVWTLEERDRLLLFLWYVRQLPVEEIARAVGVSRRQCFRRRNHAVRALIDQPDQAA